MVVVAVFSVVTFVLVIIVGVLLYNVREAALERDRALREAVSKLRTEDETIRSTISKRVEDVRGELEAQEKEAAARRAVNATRFNTDALVLGNDGRMSTNPPSEALHSEGGVHLTSDKGGGYVPFSAGKVWAAKGVGLGDGACLETGAGSLDGSNGGGGSDGNICYGKLTDELDIVGKSSGGKRRVRVHDALRAEDVDAEAVTTDRLETGNLTVVGGKGKGATFPRGANTSNTFDATSSVDEPTRFPDPSDGKNHIQGDTEIHGRSKLRGNTEVDGKVTAKGGLRTKGGSSERSTQNIGSGDDGQTEFPSGADGPNKIQGDVQVAGDVKVGRHLDARESWEGTKGALFAGWNGDKLILGNNSGRAEDYARTRQDDSIVLTNDAHFHGKAVIEGNINLKGRVENTTFRVGRHIDAYDSWNNASNGALFAGWNGDKLVLGNHRTGSFDYAADAPNNSVVITNDARVNGNVKVEKDLNVAEGGKICIEDTCVDQDGLRRLLEQNKN
jgi:cytoskeletal protein CcmA (bactofilin family)